MVDLQKSGLKAPLKWHRFKESRSRTPGNFKGYNNSQGSTGSRLGDLGGQVIGEWLVGCLVGESDIPEYLSHVCDWLIAHVYPLVTCKTCKPLNHLEPVLQTQLFTIWVCLIIKMLQVEPEAEDSYPIFWGVVKQKLCVCIIYIYTPIQHRRC